MRSGNLLYSAAQFCFAVLVLLIGALFIGLDHAPHLRHLIAAFFSEAPSFSLIGYLVVGCGLLLLFGFCRMHRGVYYSVSMGADVEQVVIQGYVLSYLKKLFPEEELLVNVNISSDRKIEVFAEFPPLPLEEQQSLLEKVERELAQLFKKQLAYSQEFTFSILYKN